MSRVPRVVAFVALAFAWFPARGQTIIADSVVASVFVDGDNANFLANPSGTSRFNQAYRRFGYSGIERDANDTSYGIDPSGRSAVSRLQRSFSRGVEVDINHPSYMVHPSRGTRLSTLYASEVIDADDGAYVWDGEGISQGNEIRSSFFGDACQWNMYGACVQMFANLEDRAGGGIAVSDDGGFGDWNDGWIRFFGSTGLDMRGRTVRTGGGRICMRAADGSDDCRDRWPATRNNTVHQRDKNCGTGAGGTLTGNGDECCSYQVNCHTQCSGWWGRGCWWGRGGGTTICDTRTECNGFRGWSNN